MKLGTLIACTLLLAACDERVPSPRTGSLTLLIVNEGVPHVDLYAIADGEREQLGHVWAEGKLTVYVGYDWIGKKPAIVAVDAATGHEFATDPIVVDGETAVEIVLAPDVRDSRYRVAYLPEDFP